MKRKVFTKEVLDPITGEYINVLMIGKRRELYDKGYVKFFVSFLEDVVLDRELSGKAITLLLYIAKSLDWNTKEVYLYPDFVAKELRVSIRQVYRWLNTLLKKEILKRTEKRYFYKLNAYTVIRGIEEEVLERELEEKLEKEDSYEVDF